MCQAVFWVLEFGFSLFCWAVVLHLRFFIRQVTFLIFKNRVGRGERHWNQLKGYKNSLESFEKSVSEDSCLV